MWINQQAAVRMRQFGVQDGDVDKKNYFDLTRRDCRNDKKEEIDEDINNAPKTLQCQLISSVSGNSQ